MKPEKKKRIGLSLILKRRILWYRSNASSTVKFCKRSIIRRKRWQARYNIQKRITQGLWELEQVKAGKLTGTPARQFLDELK